MPDRPLREAQSRRDDLALGQSRRTESYWTRTTITSAATGTAVAEVVLHSGVFKESYPGYPDVTGQAPSSGSRR